MIVAVVSLSLLLSLVEVRSQQTFPYVCFMNQTLVNHSYVDLSLVGNDNEIYDEDGCGNTGNSVQCRSDLSTCCSGTQGSHRGDWLFPNGTALPFSGGIYESRRSRGVNLRRTSGSSPSGLYCCDIATTAIHDENDISIRDTLYIGLYHNGGGS